jgi:hypothetical protein
MTTSGLPDDWPVMLLTLRLQDIPISFQLSFESVAAALHIFLHFYVDDVVFSDRGLRAL